jgi:hypothetical protein
MGAVQKKSKNPNREHTSSSSTPYAQARPKRQVTMSVNVHQPNDENKPAKRAKKKEHSVKATKPKRARKTASKSISSTSQKSDYISTCQQPRRVIFTFNNVRRTFFIQEGDEDDDFQELQERRQRLRMDQGKREEKCVSWKLDVDDCDVEDEDEGVLKSSRSDEE